MSSSIAPALLAELRQIEPDPDVCFSATGFCVRSSAGPSYYAKIGTPAETEQYQGAWPYVRIFLFKHSCTTFFNNWLIIGEAFSLQMIERAAPGLAPLVFRTGIVMHKENEDDDEEEEEDEECPFTISQYKYLQPLNGTYSLVLAKRLALELHAFKSEKGEHFNTNRDEFSNHRSQSQVLDSIVRPIAEPLVRKGLFTIRGRRVSRL